MSEKSYPFDSEYLHKKMDKTFWTYGSIVLPDLLDSSADDAPAVSLEGVLRLFSPLEVFPIDGNYLTVILFSKLFTYYKTTDINIYI